MAAGDVTMTVVGTYATLALATAAAVNLPAATDWCEIKELSGTGTNPARFAVIKYLREA